MSARVWPAWMSGTAPARVKSLPMRLDAIGMSGWLGAPTSRYDASATSGSTRTIAKAAAARLGCQRRDTRGRPSDAELSDASSRRPISARVATASSGATSPQRTSSSASARRPR